MTTPSKSGACPGAWQSYHGYVLAIEVDDIHDAHHLDTYSDVVQTFNFHQH